MTDDDKILLARKIPQPQQYSVLSELEYSVFSQWGDDGIIQYLTNKLSLSNDFFIEFGVEDYKESNTRFLMMNNNWSGLVIDGSQKNISNIVNAKYFWKYDLKAIHAFLTKENVVNLICSNSPKEIGLLHIDVDGMDYWLWEELSSAVQPDIVILEYNSVFGIDRDISVPYEPEFNRFKAHYSGLFAGASLSALVKLSNRRGYAFIGSNSAGNNAYFVKRELLNNAVKEISIEEGYIVSKFRESRNKKGQLTFLSGPERLQAIKGLFVHDTETNQQEYL